MGLFSSIGGMFDDKPSKQLKKARRETERVLFGAGGVPTGPFNLITGTATNRTTSNTGSGSTHTHTSSAIDLDVEYLNVIVCTKD